MSRRTRYVLVTLLLLLLAAGGFLSFYIRTLGPRLKDRVIRAMQDRFDADVQLADLQVSVFPEPQVDGEGLVIQHKQWGNERYPLIKIQHFHAQTDFTTILDWRNRVNKVVLDGLELHIPPRGPSTEKGIQPGHDKTRLKFLIETIVANHGLVEIEPKDPNKEPLEFPIENLTMHSVGVGQAMTFTARLTNAKPPGAIDTSGHFGPWQRDDPRATPISGIYTFEHANLSVFNGIGGTLSSSGKYGGILQHIQVEGTTDVPDFTLKKGGSPVHLTTEFHSIVDGTNGDTILDPVDAKFGHSEFICSGGITQKPGERGKTIDLQAHTKYGRMEDILTLVVNGKPILNGNVEFQSRILIPPGKQQVADKLNLDGQFHLTKATLTDEKDAERLKLLSERASGITKKDDEKGEGEKGKVASNLFAKFLLKNGIIHLANLSFEVPGAQINLAGDFNLVSSAVAMKGDFQMHATLSETQSGFKALLLKPLDPLFEKKGAGFEVPLSITGTRDKPNIGVSVFHKTFTIH
jgi:hypothetical protein